MSEIELREQRKVGKKEKGDLKERAIAELCPKFSRSKLTFGYLDFSPGFFGLIPDPIRAQMGLPPACEKRSVHCRCSLWNLLKSPVMLFTQWVADNQNPEGFVVGDQCELRSGDGTDTVIRCKGSESLHDAISTHIDNGMEVAELSLIWEEKLKLTVNEAFHLKRLKPLDIMNDKEGAKIRMRRIDSWVDLA